MFIKTVSVLERIIRFVSGLFLKLVLRNNVNLDSSKESDMKVGLIFSLFLYYWDKRGLFFFLFKVSLFLVDLPTAKRM